MTLNPYAVKIIILGSGERLPVLVALASGAPLFEPSVYVLSEIRATNRASNTIDQILRSIMVLHLFLDSNRIDIEQRIQNGGVFRLSELDELVRYCKRPVADQLKCDSISLSHPSALRRAAENVRLFQRKLAPPEVAGHTAANRIRVIRDYLDWLVRYHMARYHPGATEGARLWNEWTSCKDALGARLPRHKGRNTIGQREGLQPEVVERLLSVMSPTSPDNPWKGKSTRIRNALLVRWFYELGLRRGEVLNVKISDINFQSEDLTVVRRADDPQDPRKDQPLVKTRDRKIPLSPSLCKLTHEYITSTRRATEGARRHPYLFIAMGTGAPLSLSAVNAIFAELRNTFDGEFDAVTPHVLRHTWNDRFSDIMNNAKVSEAEEERMRSFLMGWAPTSKTSVNYTRRHVRLKAQQVSLAMQAKQVDGVTSDD
ncbi:integrase family protein [Pseudomonas amygdali pv. aesculi str. 0893_23]|uniref:tyrosine-type recombinase/integrase n=1 Tax=Pseudomonas syringae group genomosp. 2 TaxID=251698 RepID=UPI0001CC3F5E|nr:MULTISPECIES: tyrosine-type recombinase/integrase [Pseudomonas syringae group genomosp. 2]EGH04108.1 integrase family protein [Pseudomonas amygdali pv. aesculi str. 0893_23]KPW17414.1 Integrase family protein [Pseudomonas amygdali pv. aesculi]MCQ3013500.1 tyrosine-type recombinase/integrase [Pseudomonas savastanoi]